MRKYMLLLVLGLALILSASITLGALHIWASGNSHRIAISGISVEDIPLNLTEREHVLISSYSNFSYEILNSGRVVKTAGNVRNADIILDPGDYTLKIENPNDFKISVSIAMVGDAELQKFALLSYVSIAIFFVGALLTVISLGLLLWERKKEEKIYTRY